MALIPLKQTIMREAREGRDPSGRLQYGAPEPLKCRFSAGVHATRNREGTEVIAKATIHLDGKAQVSVEDRITYDENGRSHSYVVLSVEEKRGLDGKTVLLKVVHAG
jgi:hypothetical protein